jgi:hypothetical protein
MLAHTVAKSFACDELWPLDEVEAICWATKKDVKDVASRYYIVMLRNLIKQAINLPCLIDVMDQSVYVDIVGTDGRKRYLSFPLESLELALQEVKTALGSYRQPAITLPKTFYVGDI